MDALAGIWMSLEQSSNSWVVSGSGSGLAEPQGLRVDRWSPLGEIGVFPEVKEWGPALLVGPNQCWMET